MKQLSYGKISILAGILAASFPIGVQGNINETNDTINTILQEDPEKIYWKGKVMYEKTQVGINFSAIYDFSEYVIFDKDISDGRDKGKTKRYVIYAKKGPNDSLIFQGHYQGSIESIKNPSGKEGIRVNKIKKVEGEPNIEEALRRDYERYLKEHP